jgi:hypothetical protein
LTCSLLFRALLTAQTTFVNKHLLFLRLFIFSLRLRKRKHSFYVNKKENNSKNKRPSKSKKTRKMNRIFYQKNHGFIRKKQPIFKTFSNSCYTYVTNCVSCYTVVTWYIVKNDEILC